MVSVKLYRSDLLLVEDHFVPYIKLSKTSRIKNVAHLSLQSTEHLTVLAVNCITDEVVLIIKRKILLTASIKVKLKFTDAQAVIFLQLLNNLPLTIENFYLWNLRNSIVKQLDKEITSAKIYAIGQTMN